MIKLEQLLRQIDRKSYPGYKVLKGRYNFQTYTLNIEHVQGDPFASPSKLSVCVKGEKAGFPEWMYETEYKKTALEDFLLRAFYKQIGKYSHKAKGSGKSGAISVSRCGQEMLKRTGCEVGSKDGTITVRLEVGFPANGRTIQSGELQKVLYEYLPVCVSESLCYVKANQEMLVKWIQISEDQHAIREQLEQKGLVAFVANGSILPRASGALDTPMNQAVPFLSPPEREVCLTLPHKGEVKGLGIAVGITLIVGGGYHGKSTLLNALEKGVYNHIPGDGRDYVIAEASSMKIRAEDGRSIKGTNISPFIANLPNKKDTVSFHTEDASGSTSQAANVVEAIAAGSQVLLIDEDTSATNFMVRDELMQRVVRREKEPIIPFVERAQEMYRKFGVSTVMVAGSSGAYFHIADDILQMDEYIPKEITALARKEAEAFPMLDCEVPIWQEVGTKRIPKWNRNVRGNVKVKVKVLGKDQILLGREEIDLRLVEQLIDAGQTRAIGYILWYMEEYVFDGRKTVNQCVAEVMELIHTKGLAAVVMKETLPGNLAVPRKEEVYACINRYRGLGIEK